MPEAVPHGLLRQASPPNSGGKSPAAKGVGAQKTVGVTRRSASGFPPVGGQPQPCCCQRAPGQRATRRPHPANPGGGLHLVVALRKRPWAAPHQKQTAAAAQRGPTPETKAALDGCGWHCLGNVRGWGSAQKDGGRR